MIRRKRTIFAALILATLLLSPVLSVRADVSLAIDQCHQEQTQWCWAATSQAVLRFYGHTLTQTEIAAYGTEGANEWNWLWGESSYPDPTRRGIDMILNYFASLPATAWEQALTAESSETLMLNRQMFFIRWYWDGGGGHFVLPKAISGTTWTLMDPWYGPTINTYSWVVSGSGHTWTHSLSLNTAAPFPRGDVNASGTVDLTDVIRAMQIASGSLPVGTPVTKDADVDSNGNLGVAEAIYALQKVADLL